MRWLLLFTLFHPSIRCPLDGADMRWTGEIDQKMIAPAVACRYVHRYVKANGEMMDHYAWARCGKRLKHPDKK